jgi:6-pyruvoyltetrahydropterin/6-carboxytetrahydropterin synthase
MHTVTKSYWDLPAAHRQPKHDGHCSLIHGHNWGFDIVFGCDVLDENGFVVDVGKLKPIKQWLEETFDHTLLLNEEDPLLDYIQQSFMRDLCRMVIVPNCGMEGLAKLVFEKVSMLLANHDAFALSVLKRTLLVIEVTCWEDSKNRATYRS